MDVTFALVDVIATAVAVDPDKPEGDVLNPTIGVPVNPEPSLFKNISRTTPVATTGVGYGTAPTVTIGVPAGATAADRATGITSIGIDPSSGFNRVNSIFITNAGAGYTGGETVTIADPETISGVGTYLFNEIVQGMRSGTQARVKSWDVDTGILQVGNIGIGTTPTGFFAGEDIKGLTSGALFSVSNFDDDTDDKYNEGDIFESEADLIIDFSESNPFGSF